LKGLDPDPGGPKTYGFGSGFKSASLLSGMSLLGRVADRDSDESALFWEAESGIKMKIEKLYRLQMEPWRVVDAHNGGLEAQNALK
jgi:hypothetical protein